ncbi:MAG: ParB N-terminal domain-containing protein [Planctomycetes bacterium]|nr:ParB N-terminal domain-containing protein [Planctomycetota bacterium]
MTEAIEHKIREKLLDLGNGTSIWRVHLDWLREMEENARVMDPDRFERLVANVRKDARLESLPLVTPNPERPEEFLIISGHHRTRAARSAGVMEIVVLCIDQGLSMDQIKSKQLAHNFLNGEDDKQMLRRIVAQIQDQDALIESGLAHLREDLPDQRIQVDEVKFDIDFEVVNVVFLSHQKQKFDQAIELLGDKGDILVEELPAFARFKEAVAKTSQQYNIRNVPGILAKMAEVVLEHAAAAEAAEGEQVPAEAAGE